LRGFFYAVRQIPKWIEKAIHKGDMPQVPIEHNGTVVNAFLIANVKERTLDAYDGSDRIAQFNGMSAKYQEKQEKKNTMSEEQIQKRNETMQAIRERIAPRPVIPSVEKEQAQGQRRGRHR